MYQYSLPLHFIYPRQQKSINYTYCMCLCILFTKRHEEKLHKD